MLWAVWDVLLQDIISLHLHLKHLDMLVIPYLLRASAQKVPPLVDRAQVMLGTLVISLGRPRRVIWSCNLILQGLVLAEVGRMAPLNIMLMLNLHAKVWVEFNLPRYADKVPPLLPAAQRTVTGERKAITR